MSSLCGQLSGSHGPAIWAQQRVEWLPSLSTLPHPSPGTRPVQFRKPSPLPTSHPSSFPGMAAVTQSSRPPPLSRQSQPGAHTSGGPSNSQGDTLLLCWTLGQGRWPQRRRQPQLFQSLPGRFLGKQNPDSVTVYRANSCPAVAVVVTDTWVVVAASNGRCPWPGLGRILKSEGAHDFLVLSSQASSISPTASGPFVSNHPLD